MAFLEKIFHIKERGSSLKTEIIGGLIVFVAMCYILPVNAELMSHTGMNKQGVFAMTAIVGAIVTLIMGLVANYPIALSAGMGLNAYIADVVTGFDNWQQKMIILTVTGILFFIFSLTPVRKIIIEKFPKSLKAGIAASLGGFIAYVGLKGAGVVDFTVFQDAENVVTGVVPTIGNLADPGVLIALLSCIVCLALMQVNNKHVKQLAIPISVLIAAIAGVCVSCGITYSGSEMALGTLPTLPWESVKNGTSFFGSKGIEEVVFFGALSKTGYSPEQFGNDLAAVFSSPATYVAIFSLMFVNLFDTTATLFAVGGSTNLFNEDGSMNDYKKVIMADATGAAICAPLGTSTVTSFAESNCATSMGARTGLTACVVAVMFLLSAFIYPVFEVFTAPSVTACALMCVGASIFVNNVKEIEFKDPVLGFSTFTIIIVSILTYSLSNGIGVGLIAYCVMMICSKRAKEVNVPLYCISGVYAVLLILDTVLKTVL